MSILPAAVWVTMLVAALAAGCSKEDAPVSPARTAEALPTVSPSVESPEAGAPPSASVDATLSTVSGAIASDAPVLAGLRPGMMLCFELTLQHEPGTPDGNVTMSIAILSNGDINSVTPSASTLPPADVTCVGRKLRNAKFGPGPQRLVVVTVSQSRLG